MKTVAVLMGTRPEAIKLCPVILELQKREGIRTVVCATGQHGRLLRQATDCFGVRADETLPLLPEGSGLEQMTAHLLNGIGGLLSRIRPDLVLVQGDTASAFAGALAAFYRGIPVAHVEAGLRTYHIRSPFPEEMHRQVIATLADWHFAPTAKARRNLLQAGIPEKRVFLTGNTGIDALKYSLVNGIPRNMPELPEGKRLILFTAHRRENWGEPMRGMFRALRCAVEQFPDSYAVCPLHPNPAVREIAAEILRGCERVRVIDPPELTSFHHLLSRAYLVLTDSGGIQEEATALGIPTVIMRYSTERTEGIRAGCLRLAGTDEEGVLRTVQTLLAENSPEYISMHKPSGVFGDGNAAVRIVSILAQRLGEI